MSETTEGARGSLGAPSAPDFSEMLGRVLANPDILNAVAAAVSGGAERNAPPEKAMNAQAERIASDELMNKLPEVIGVLGPVMSGKGETKVRADDKRACLLRAIKPYVNPSRQEAIEYMIKFSALTELLRGKE